MIWRGSKPFTVGILDEHGNVVESFTAQPGHMIPPKWMQVIRETPKADLLEVHDKGKHDPKQVKQEFLKKWKPPSKLK